MAGGLVEKDQNGPGVASFPRHELMNFAQENRSTVVVCMTNFLTESSFVGSRPRVHPDNSTSGKDFAGGIILLGLITSAILAFSLKPRLMQADFKANHKK